MYKLSWSNSFRRGFKKATRKNSILQEKIFSALEKLSKQPFDPELKTHKLHGKLMGPGKNLIVLVDIGKHDEVY